MTTSTETDLTAAARGALQIVCSGQLDRRPEFDDQVTEGDTVATRWTLHGTYRRKAVTLHGIVISRFRDGRIIEDHAASDSLELPRALGLARTAMLVIDVVRGRVKLPRGALGKSH